MLSFHIHSYQTIETETYANVLRTNSLMDNHFPSSWQNEDGRAMRANQNKWEIMLGSDDA